VRPQSPYSPAMLAEARRLGAALYPSHALYGHYLEWVSQHIVSAAPERVSIVLHTVRALTLDDMHPSGPQALY
jgi:hypothetical protein